MEVSRGAANGLKVSRSEAFRAVQLVSHRARKRFCEYHTKGPWMTMLVNAIEQLLIVDWDLLDDDYDGYDGEPREGVVSDKMARIGHCWSYGVPVKICNDCVPSEVNTHIRNWKAEMSKFPVRPLTDLYKLSCNALLRDGLLHTPTSGKDSNCYAFVRPKSSQNCAFIVEMRNLIDECTVKPRKSPLPTVGDIHQNGRDEAQGTLTTIDLTNFYY